MFSCGKMGSNMMRAGYRWATLTLMLGLLLVGAMVTGCNQGEKFDPNLLFTLEDYAQDQDYAIEYIIMMNQWRASIEAAKPNLAGNISGIPFTEAVPDGWLPISESELFNPPQYTGDWYYSSFQDAQYNLIRIDQDVPASAPLHPARVDYGTLKLRNNPIDNTSMATGNMISVYYANDYENRSILEGSGAFSNVSVLFFTRGSSAQQQFPAAMVNEWSGDFTGIAATPDNPTATFTVNGTTTILRIDNLDSITQQIRGETIIRSNGQGTTSVYVDDVERARITFESLVGTHYTGYFTTRSTNFEQRLRF